MESLSRIDFRPHPSTGPACPAKRFRSLNRLKILLKLRDICILALSVTGLLTDVSMAPAADHATPPTAMMSNLSTPTVLPPIMVHASREPITDAAKIIDKNILDKIPTANGSINEALSFLPDIQFSETSNLSAQGGEILPSAVSISGGRGFENNFLIDGLSNNSLIDPDADNPLSNNDVPGHAQEIFLGTSLVGGVTVYDNNVPASYGDFKGGVVHASTIDPRPESGGSLFYRTTRDAWTEFHIAATEKEKFENSGDHTRQPEFEKHQTGFDVHVPLTPQWRLLGAYQLFLSTIPLQNLGESRKQHRRNETFLLKLAGEPTPRHALNLTYLYSPYEGQYFKKDFRDSGFTIRGGAYRISAEATTELSFADLHLRAGYGESENSRQGPDHMIQVQNPDNSWDKEGFAGDVDKKQQTFQLKTDLKLHPILTGAVAHELNIGGDFQHIQGTSERDQTSYLYTYYASGTARRNVYEKYSVQAILRQYSLYAEDILHYKRLELRPGLRLSYDDFMENLNAAPRLAAAVDIFGNGKTILVGGINRYYANTLLTYKLRADMPDTNIEQWSGTDGWALWKSSSTTYGYSSLKTPYADEYVVGIEQQLYGGKASAKYVQRNGRDEFARTMTDKQPDGKFYYTLNNNGRSHHESYRVSWERQWRHHFLSINGTYQKSESSNESYDDLLNDEDLDEEIWYDGGVILKSELPRKNFNRPWLVNLLYVGEFPHNISFSSQLKYRSGYWTLQKSGQTHTELGIPIYEKTRLGGAITLNCKLDWHTRLWAGNGLTLSLEILNLLDKKSAVGEVEDGYEMGRQFWLGARYTF